MTTIRQLIQSSPARANELFAELMNTSQGAAKTRERLVAELKNELETLASLEEQHLFPALRKRKPLQKLVRGALADNRSTRKLLAQLESMPKDSEEFAQTLAELRKVFQRHIRDERKELLPAAPKALSDEEARIVVEQIEAGRAEAEELQRAEAQEHRAAARRQREQVERMQAAAEWVASTLLEPPVAAHAVAEAQEVVQAGLRTSSEAAQGAIEQTTELLDTIRRGNRQLAERTPETFEGLAPSATAIALEMQDVSGECLEMVQERLECNLRAMTALLRCRTFSELLAVQGTVLRENVELTVGNSRRLAAASARLAGTMTRSLAAPAGRTLKRAA